MTQKSQMVDVLRSFMPGDPNVLHQNMVNTERDDGEEKNLPIVAYEARNILPTSYGYKSYFGLNSTLDIDSLGEKCQKVILYQTPDYTNWMIGLCEDGAYIVDASTQASTWTQVIDTGPADPEVYRLWTYCIIENILYLYQQGIAKYYKSDVDNNGDLTFTGVTPSFLNMAGQMGIFKAGTRLGFWDSANSVSWSNAVDFTDFTPSIETLAGNTIFNTVTGRIILCFAQGDGFIVYCSESVVGVSTASTEAAVWEGKKVLDNAGITHPQSVCIGQTDSEHFVYTTQGIYRIGKFDRLQGRYDFEQIFPDLYDFLKEDRNPVYMDVMHGRYLFLGLLNNRYINGMTSYSYILVKGLPFELIPLPATYFDLITYDGRPEITKEFFWRFGTQYDWFEPSWPAPKTIINRNTNLPKTDLRGSAGENNTTPWLSNGTGDDGYITEPIFCFRAYDLLIPDYAYLRIGVGYSGHKDVGDSNYDATTDIYTSHTLKEVNFKQAFPASASSPVIFPEAGNTRRVERAGQSTVYANPTDTIYTLISDIFNDLEESPTYAVGEFKYNNLILNRFDSSGYNGMQYVQYAIDELFYAEDTALGIPTSTERDNGASSGVKPVVLDVLIEWIAGIDMRSHFNGQRIKSIDDYFQQAVDDSTVFTTDRIGFIRTTANMNEVPATTSFEYTFEHYKHGYAAVISSTGMGITAYFANAVITVEMAFQYYYTPTWYSALLVDYGDRTDFMIQKTNGPGAGFYYIYNIDYSDAYRNSVLDRLTTYIQDSSNNFLKTALQDGYNRTVLDNNYGALNVWDSLPNAYNPGVEGFYHFVNLSNTSAGGATLNMRLTLRSASRYTNSERFMVELLDKPWDNSDTDRFILQTQDDTIYSPLGGTHFFLDAIINGLRLYGIYKRFDENPVVSTVTTLMIGTVYHLDIGANADKDTGNAYWYDPNTILLESAYPDSEGYYYITAIVTRVSTSGALVLYPHGRKRLAAFKHTMDSLGLVGDLYSIPYTVAVSGTVTSFNIATDTPFGPNISSVGITPIGYNKYNVDTQANFTLLEEVRPYGPRTEYSNDGPDAIASYDIYNQPTRKTTDFPAVNDTYPEWHIYHEEVAPTISYGGVIPSPIDSVDGVFLGNWYTRLLNYTRRGWMTSRLGDPGTGYVYKEGSVHYETDAFSGSAKFVYPAIADLIIDPNYIPDHSDQWIMPGAKYLLQQGTPFPLYPTICGAFVYDLQLKKWGKLSEPYKCLVPHHPINGLSSVAIPYTQEGIDGGLLQTDGVIRMFDSQQGGSYIRYGKIGLYRIGFTHILEIRVHFRKPFTGGILIEGSLDGLELDNRFSSVEYFEDTRVAIMYPNKRIRWATVTIFGKYDIQYLEVRANISGRR
jgi:hypothetical protein